jgi:uncharacterized protein YndB with AHSA1/START domain
MTAGTEELRLHLERILPAPRELVFAMHAEANRLARWWGPNGFTVPNIQLDLRVGGTYRIEMDPPDGNPFHLSGVFREVDPPARLVYTFAWEEPDPDDRETIVSFALDDQGPTTKLVLDQGAFATDARLALHTQGWSETIDRLEQRIAEEVTFGA